ncbi:MAG: 4Fe-4S dicluster domain-containing protein [Acidobacteria bacterium]|nr:4Fe-4S dicluster domain-containing protein [Acidobacteriota bacterium]
MSAHDTITRGDAIGIDRREFFRLSSAVAAARALASTACQVPPEASIPFHDMPESLVDGMGRARYFHTVLDGTPIRVRTREGRPILVTPVADDASGRGLTARHHAALMDLYDPDRARGPLSVRRQSSTAVPMTWTAVGREVVDRVKAAGSKAVLLTGPVDSPALASAITSLTTQSGLRHVVWSPLGSSAAAEAWTRAFGDAALARPRLGTADLIVGLGAEFLDRPADGMERDFASRRVPNGSAGRAMSRFVQLEGRLTLTGANADQRIRVRDTHLAAIGAALAHELIVVRGIGPLAGNAEVAQALAPYATATGIDQAVLMRLAGELAAARGRALVMAGGAASTSGAGSAIELAALLLNYTLGAFEAGLFDEAAASPVVPDTGAALAALADEMRAGGVDVLIVAGANPVYDAPGATAFADAMAKVTFVVSLNDRLDETSVLADVMAPASHPFESWSDATLPGGRLAVQQPVIQPLFDTQGILDVLLDWAAALGDNAARLAVQAATAPPPAPAPASAERAPSTSVAFHFLRTAWAGRMGLDATTPVFADAWNDVLRKGMWQGPAPTPAVRTFQSAALSLLPAGLSSTANSIELQLYPHLALADGRAGNNGWLHELPDPITRLTWGGALSIAPRRFDEMGLENGDLIEVDAGHAKVVAPAYRHAGMHHDQVALPLGLGRTGCGAIGNGIGPNAFALRRLADRRLVAAGLPVTLRKVGGRETLAVAQGSDVIDRARRPIVPTTTLTAYEANPAAGTEQTEGGASAWPEHEYPNTRWGMSIDLTKCIGCSKCVIGCQAENNIPVVGPEGIIRGREMSWMRIDRYYDAPSRDGGWDAEVWDGPLDVVEEPQTLFEPMLCQHCENAPCETVCPFSATMHSADGLNQQVYNRCVGTRYCANNCPFKVRRFNYWELSERQNSSFFRWLVPAIAKNAELNTREPMPMKNNPEVTVRSRGVMEKCSFCVQRISAARAEAARNGGDKNALPDGAVVPACMEACPTNAITFGNLNAPDSRVARQAADPRAMRLLDAVGVKPSISYLTKVRNDKA